MLKHWRAILLVIVGVAGALFWYREPLMMAWLASKIEKTDLAQHQDLIRDFIDIRLPESGAAPFPVVLQFHGCAGMRPEFHRQWADIANKAGYAVMIVDSNRPRGYSRREALDTICRGKALLGQERAGDIYAALTLAQEDERLDTERLVLAGWSHGAWTVMDYLTMDASKNPLPGFARVEAPAPDVGGAILFYPHCGPGALSQYRQPVQTPQMLVFIAGADEIVDAEKCIKYFERRKQRGDPVDFTIYPDANHVFDDPFLEPEWIHWYNEDYTKDAMQKYEAFLNRLN
jgi:dienelactone hydrolase